MRLDGISNGGISFDALGRLDFREKFYLLPLVLFH